MKDLKIVATRAEVVDGTKIRLHVVLELCAEAVSTEADLTLREKDVLRHVLTGKANKEIAEVFHISERCIKFHMSSILKKYGVAKRQELIARVANVAA